MPKSNSRIELFEHLERLSVALNAASDKNAQTIKSIEAKLASLRLGVEAWVKEPFDVKEEKDGGGKLDDVVSSYLGYAKIRGNWCLWVKKNSDRWDDMPGYDGELIVEPEYIPLKEVSRELRVAALSQIPQLIKELEKKAESFLDLERGAHLLTEDLT